MFWDIDLKENEEGSETGVKRIVSPATRKRIAKERANDTKKNSIEAFFYLIWKKDKMFENNLRLHIPNTAFFKHGGITIWYFTDRNTEIKRKKDKNCTLEGFKDCLLRKKPKSKLGVAL